VARGQSTIAVALAGQGVSERADRRQLERQGGPGDEERSIDAIDVAKVLRGIEPGALHGPAHRGRREDAFSELAGIFAITNGVADNQDLRLVSANVRVTGAGSFNLPARTLDYTVRPKSPLSMPRQRRAVINLSNVDIPGRIEGPWDKPNFSVAGQSSFSRR